MLFAVTTIRINQHTRVFENTEVNRVMLLGDIVRELIANGCIYTQFEEVITMEKGSSVICESTTFTGPNQGTRFIYIHRVG